ncbi:hypothetical protein PENTCL1PPCAC_5514, partial [Pristionchus entomophagus]
KCRLCATHGTIISRISHCCPFADCPCSRCVVIRAQRATVAKQSKMRRNLKKGVDTCALPSIATSSFTSSESPKAPNRGYRCRKCLNHGINVSKKKHRKECPYALCDAYATVLEDEPMQEEPKHSSDESDVIAISPDLLPSKSTEIYESMPEVPMEEENHSTPTPEPVAIVKVESSPSTALLEHISTNFLLPPLRERIITSNSTNAPSSSVPSTQP